MNITCYMHSITLKKAIVYVHSGAVVPTNALFLPFPSHFHIHMCGLCLCLGECIVYIRCNQLEHALSASVLLASCFIALVHLQEHNLVNLST